MRKIILTAVVGAAISVAPAIASKPAQPSHPAKPDHPTAKAKGRCKPHHAVGYNASGALVASSLTQTQGQGTTDTSDDRYSGTVEVNVTKANHKGPKGDQTFTLTDAQVSFYNDANGQPVTTPAAGDTVRLHGKVGHAPKKCGGDQVATVSRVAFQQAQPAEQPATPETDTQS